MRLTALLPLFLIPFISASPVLETRAKNPGDPAGSAKVYKDIKKIGAGVKTLNATVASFQGGLAGLATALQIMQQTQDLENDINTAINDTNAASKFNNAQSAKVGIATLGLSPMIKDLLNNIVEHKPEFVALAGLPIDLSKTVEKDLTTQRSLTKTLAAAIKSKLTKQYAALAPSTTKTILGYFNKAIKAYKKCTNPICPPPLG